jgi:hypothetical protein
MANDQFFVTKIDKPMKQGDRIAAAGNTDEIVTRWRKVAQRFFRVD